MTIESITGSSPLGDRSPRQQYFRQRREEKGFNEIYQRVQIPEEEAAKAVVKQDGTIDLSQTRIGLPCTILYRQ